MLVLCSVELTLGKADSRRGLLRRRYQNWAGWIFGLANLGSDRLGGYILASESGNLFAQDAGLTSTCSAIIYISR